MAGRQEIITKADADMEIEERKALGLEQRLNERHQLRMEWYRGRIIRQFASFMFGSIVFGAVTYVAVNYDWWIAVTAAFCGGVFIAMASIINITAQPPED